MKQQCMFPMDTYLHGCNAEKSLKETRQKDGSADVWEEPGREGQRSPRLRLGFIFLV